MCICVNLASVTSHNRPGSHCANCCMNAEQSLYPAEFAVQVSISGSEDASTGDSKVHPFIFRIVCAPMLASRAG